MLGKLWFSADQQRHDDRDMMHNIVISYEEMHVLGNDQCCISDNRFTKQGGELGEWPGS